MHRSDPLANSCLVQEGGRKPPPYPSIFIKPRASVASYNEPIPIPRLAQEDQLDYEGELCIVIGKTGKNIPESEALDHIAGYVSSNDVSARKWQRDPAFAGGVPQWCFSKGFDKYAPLGPMLVSPRVVGNAGNLRLQTWVNGELRQDTNTSDLLFGVEKIVAFISQGTTLEKGTVIMTGTPAGVAMGMKEPKWLKDGDVVEVRVEELGSVKNTMSFE
jgi:2-keto-4-pentenoate hydratase/2-oxohepta-3-ene-1,7-dioic acid hydratase in catechol pathway